MVPSWRFTLRLHAFPQIFAAAALLAFPLHLPAAAAGAEPDPAAPATQATQSRALAGTRAPAMRLAEDGVVIDALGMGELKLNYPAPGASQAHTHGLIEKHLTGSTATLIYEGGGRIELSLGRDGTIGLSVSSMPADVAVVSVAMVLDFGFSAGGTWRIDNAEALPFPATTPTNPNLYQGNARRLTLRNGDGESITFEFPGLGYAQLQDNRAWDWKTYGWFFVFPCGPATPPLRYRVSLGGAPKSKVVADEFGQSATMDYPGKVASIAELRADVASEARWLAGLKPPARDAYGGLPGSGATLGLDASGYFRIQQRGDKSYLVDPLGNAFFQLGICAFGPADDFTYVTGRERSYRWLPAPGDSLFGSAFLRSYPTSFSFHLANRIRKTGAPFALDEYLRTMIARGRAWGFNSCGAFSAAFEPAERQGGWPYVATLPLSKWQGMRELPGVAGVWDPYDGRNRALADSLLGVHVTPHANDPLLIGYFTGNEPEFEKLRSVLPTLDATWAAKREFVAGLRRKYATLAAFNRAWHMRVRSFDELERRGLPVTTLAARADRDAFTGRFLERYFSTVSAAFRRHDANHLLLGNRFRPATIAKDDRLIRSCGKYVDVFSVNYYANRIDPRVLDRVHRVSGAKPLLLSEFYFASPSDSRLPGGGPEVASQAARGKAYRAYVEQAAALGYVVGTEWFTLVDQSLTGRYFERYNGQNSNTGLISVADRPWRAMIEQMIPTNYGIYDVLLGKRPAYR